MQNYRRTISALFITALFLVGVATATPPAGNATKVLLDDGTVRELSNSGTANAINRILAQEQMPDQAKTQAIEAILGGAQAAGTLTPATVVEDDQILVFDPTYQKPEIGTVLGGSIRLPDGRLEAIGWIVPLG